MANTRRQSRQRARKTRRSSGRVKLRPRPAGPAHGRSSRSKSARSKRPATHPAARTLPPAAAGRGPVIVVSSARASPVRSGAPLASTSGAARTIRGSPAGAPGAQGNGPASGGFRPRLTVSSLPASPTRVSAARPASSPFSLRPVSLASGPAITGRPSRRPSLASRKREVCAMVLAAGLGKRMQSQSTKLIHAIAGRPMVRHVVEAAKAAGMSRTVVVVGNQADEVRRAVGETDKRIGFAYQDSQRGTGHAVLSAEGHLLGYEGDVLILNGDLPALRPDTLHRFVDFHRASGAPLSLMTAVVRLRGAPEARWKSTNLCSVSGRSAGRSPLRMSTSPS